MNLWMDDQKTNVKQHQEKMNAWMLDTDARMGQHERELDKIARHPRHLTKQVEEFLAKQGSKGSACKGCQAWKDKQAVLEKQLAAMQEDFANERKIHKVRCKDWDEWATNVDIAQHQLLNATQEGPTVTVEQMTAMQRQVVEHRGMIDGIGTQLLLRTQAQASAATPPGMELVLCQRGKGVRPM